MEKKVQDNKEKYRLLNTIWTVIKYYGLLYGGEDSMVRYGKSVPQQQQQYTGDTFVV